MSYQGTKTIGGGGSMPFVDARQGQRDINQLRERERQRKEKASALADDQKRLEMLAQGLGAGKEVKSMSRGELKGFIENKLAMATKEKEAADRSLAERAQRTNEQRVAQGGRQLDLQQKQFKYKQKRDKEPTPLKRLLNLEKPNTPRPDLNFAQREQAAIAASGLGGPHRKAAPKGTPAQYDPEGFRESLSQPQRNQFNRQVKKGPWDLYDEQEKRANLMRKKLGPELTGAAEAGVPFSDIFTALDREKRGQPISDDTLTVMKPGTDEVLGWKVQTGPNSWVVIPKDKMHRQSVALEVAQAIQDAVNAGDVARVKNLLRDHIVTDDYGDSDWDVYADEVIDAARKNREMDESEGGTP